MALRFSDDKNQVVFEFPTMIDSIYESWPSYGVKKIILKELTSSKEGLNAPKNEVDVYLRPIDLAYLNGFMGKRLKTTITIEVE
jgi:hypothetical protein